MRNTAKPTNTTDRSISMAELLCPALESTSGARREKRYSHHDTGAEGGDSESGDCLYPDFQASDALRLPVCLHNKKSCSKLSQKLKLLYCVWKHWLVRVYMEYM